MDYWLGDEILIPPAMDEQFAERVWRLPRTWVAYAPLTAAPQPAWRPAPDAAVRIGSFNNLGKLTPETIALWARVLHALPEGRLLLKARALVNASQRRRMLDAFAAHGIEAERIELQRAGNWTDYMAEYNRLDVALDPIDGHGGGATTCDTLWMGVPVIHMPGDRPASRFTASLLTAIGRPEWIAGSEAEYVEKAVELARNAELRAAVRRTQRERMARSPLCDSRGLAASLEDAYFEMYRRWSEGRATR